MTIATPPPPERVQQNGPEAPKHVSPRASPIVLIAGLVIGVTMFVVPAPAGINPAGWRVLGLLIPVVAVWATDAMPVGVASVVFLALVVAFRFVPADVAFKGFTNHLPWLVAGAFAIGAAMERTGLSRRITYFLLSRVRGFWGLTGAAFVANGCMMAVPSSAARSGILAPVLASIMNTIGNPIKSNLSRLLTFNFCNATNAFVGTMFLTGGESNVVLIALYSAVTGKSLSWTQWLMLMFVPAVFCSLVAVGCAYLFSPPERALEQKLRDSTAARDAYATLPPMTTEEWKVVGAFILAVTLWVIGGPIDLSPGFAALLVMGLLFIPKVGVLPRQAIHDINWDNVLLIGAVMGVAGILDSTGMISMISKAFVAPVLDPLSHYGLLGLAIGCTLVGLVAHFLLPAPNNITLAIPLLVNWGFKVLHLPAAVVLAFLGLLSALGDKNIVFPYQMPPVYVYLAFDVTDVPRFSNLLIKLWPFNAVATIVAAYFLFGLIKLTGYGI